MRLLSLVLRLRLGLGLGLGLGFSEFGEVGFSELSEDAAGEGSGCDGGRLSSSEVGAIDALDELKVF